MNIFSTLIGMLPPAVQKYLPWITLVAAVSGGGVIYTQEEQQCSEETIAAQFVQDSLVSLNLLRKQLREIGFSDVAESGVIDSDVTNALLGLCGNLETAGGQYVVESLNDSIDLLAAFANKFTKEGQTWQSLADNVGFKSWLQNQSDEIKQQVANAVSAGTAPPINILYQYDLSVGGAGSAISSMPTPLNLLFKDTMPPKQLELAPLQWTAPEPCDCAPEVMPSDRYPNYIYGLAPYWNTEAIEVDFSSLTRIGYYGLSLDQHFDIVDKKNWINRPPFNDFLINARQYKTRVDLSIYNNQWNSWLFNHEGVEFTDPREEQRWIDEVKRDQKMIADLLIYKLDLLVKAPLNDFPMNNLKPIISFGQSPSRTMADGVTLHFDFSGRTDEEQQTIFKALQETHFFSNLKRVLNNGDPESNDYFLNLIIPASDVINNNGFYSLKNLMILQPHINLLIVDLKKDETALAKLRELRRQIEEQGKAMLSNDLGWQQQLKYLQQERSLLEKMLPMVSAKDSDQRAAEFSYMDWSFSGVALGPLPFNINVSDKLKQGFIDSGAVNPLEAQLMAPVEQACTYLCPLRWYLRLALFVMVLAIPIMAILPCPLQERMTPNITTAALLSYVAVFIATFWCDPYWQAQQDIMLVIITASLFLGYYYRNLKKQREKSYP